jgi:hypothetical protein
MMFGDPFFGFRFGSELTEKGAERDLATPF